MRLDLGLVKAGVNYCCGAVLLLDTQEVERTGRRALYFSPTSIGGMHGEPGLGISKAGDRKVDLELRVDK